MNNKWFESRGLKVLNYQSDAIKKVQESLDTYDKTLLAACPSAGKTLMSIYIIEEYLIKNPTHKIIVLTHGTTVLRTQFHDTLEEYKPDFTYELIEKSSDYNNTNASVVVCLPQTLVNCDLKDTQLLIVDEAHHFYLSEKAKMIKDIIAKSGVKKHLLLTGTPSKFIFENLKLNKDEYNIIPVVLNTIYDAGMVSEAYVEVASSTYNFSLDDYNSDDELKTSIHIKSADTNKTLDDLLGQIVYRLRSFRGNVYTNITPDWNILLKELKKTMFACRSIQQAEQIKKYLTKKGIDCALSTSENDIDSLEIGRFKNEEQCLVLIVVFRGVLGFNFEQLVNVVDMTTSHNIDRIYQLFSRVIRVDTNNPQQKKLFFKVSPNMLTDYFKHIMTAMLMLSDESFFTKFNGKNFNDMQIPVKRISKPRETKSNETSSGGGTSNGQRKYEPIDMEGLPVFEFFKNILHKKDELLTTYCMTTVRDVRAEFMKTMPNGYWTKKKCLESALKYTSIIEWRNSEGSAYVTAKRNKWLDLCCEHMINSNVKWNKEKCIESSSHFKSIKEWSNDNPSAYQTAKHNGWLDECKSHMKPLINPNGTWTFEKCLECALKYDNITDWKFFDGKSYAATRNHDKTNGSTEWYDKCKEHMTPKRQDKWTKEKCLIDALKYTRIVDWDNGGNAACQIARKNGWLDECTAHMKKTK